MDYDYLLNSVTTTGIYTYIIFTFISIYFLIQRINSRSKDGQQGSNYTSTIIFMYMCISILPAYILHLLI